MDPVTALAVAGNVVQFVQFSYSLVSKGRQLYKAKDGALSENVDLDLITQDLMICSARLKQPLLMGDYRNNLLGSDSELVALCDGCSAVGTQLLANLNRLKVSGQHRKWRSVRQAIKTVWTKQDVDAIAERLKGFRNQLEMHILVSLQEKVSQSSAQQNAKLARNMDQDIKELMDQLKENSSTVSKEFNDQTSILSEILEDQSLMFSKLQINEHEKTRELINQVMQDTQNIVTDAGSVVGIKVARLNLPIFEVPFSPSPNFTGRSGILSKMHKHFTSFPSRIQRRLSLYGLEGIGKTQIALAYATQCIERYETSVFWINASSTESISYDIGNLCDIYGIAESTSNDKIKAFNNFLTTQMSENHWLVIFDNADNLEGIELARYFPRVNCGNILITSRDKSITDLILGIEVDEMELEDAKSFLISRASLGCLLTEEIATVTEIVSDLGCLPLMLDQAGAFIKATGVTLATYLSYVKKQKAEIFNYNRHSAPGLAECQKSVKTTWTISFDRIRRRSESAARLLLTLAYLDYTLIWEGMLQLAFQKYQDSPSEAISPNFPNFFVELFANDGYGFNIVMEELLTFSFVRRKNGNINIHPLVGLCARQWTDERQLYIKQTMSIVWNASMVSDYREQFKILPQVNNCCDLSVFLNADGSGTITTFVLLCIKYSLMADQPLAFLSIAESFLDHVNEPKVALMHAHQTIQAYSATDQISEAELFYQTSLRWIKDLEPIDPYLNSMIGLLTLSMATLYLDALQYEKVRTVLQSWSPLDPEKPSREESYVLAAKERELVCALYYCAGCFKIGEKVLRTHLDGLPPGGERWTVLLDLAAIYLAENRFKKVSSLITTELSAQDTLSQEGFLSHWGFLVLSRLNTLHGEALIELGQHLEAKALLTNSLKLLEDIPDTKTADLRRQMLFILCGLAELEHKQGELMNSIKEWKFVLEFTQIHGFDGNYAWLVDLIYIFLDDALWELGEYYCNVDVVNIRCFLDFIIRSMGDLKGPISFPFLGNATKRLKCRVEKRLQDLQMRPTKIAPHPGHPRLEPKSSWRQLGVSRIHFVRFSGRRLARRRR